MTEDIDPLELLAAHVTASSRRGASVLPDSPRWDANRIAAYVLDLEATIRFVPDLLDHLVQLVEAEAAGYGTVGDEPGRQSDVG